MDDTKSSPRAALIVAILGSSMAFVDTTVVNVALPVIQRDLSASVETMQWVVEAYALFLASLVLVGGALGDRLGRRRVFCAGTLLFAVASAACGLAPSATALIVARGVQGVGGAMLVPGSLALISAAYDEDSRGEAIGTWSSASAVTSSIGPVLGGWVVGHASWRWLFFFNVPVGALVILIAYRSVRETRDEGASAKMDWTGALLTVLGLGAIVYALLAGGPLTSPRTLTLLAMGCGLLVVFVFVERTASAPMVPLSLFRSKAFAGANLLTFLLYAPLGGALFFIPFNLIQVQRYTPSQSGAALLPMVLLISVMSRWAGGLVTRHGARPPLVLGPLITACGFALLAVPGRGGSYWSTFFPAVVVLGFGMGLTVAPLTTTVMTSVESRHSGVASGINNATARTAGLLAVAALGVVMVVRFQHAVDDALRALALPGDAASVVQAQRARLTGASFDALADRHLAKSLDDLFKDAFVSGFRVLMLVSAALAAASGLVALYFFAPARAK